MLAVRNFVEGLGTRLLLDRGGFPLDEFVRANRFSSSRRILILISTCVEKPPRATTNVAFVDIAWYNFKTLIGFPF